jgi:hypothetical protein
MALPRRLYSALRGFVEFASDFKDFLWLIGRRECPGNACQIYIPWRSLPILGTALPTRTSH